MSVHLHGQTRWARLLAGALAAVTLVRELPAQTTPLVPAIGRSGMVSTAHPAATAAGLEILRRGGNAFDAAVAIAAALNVVEPMNSGIGGYGTILVYDARSRQVLFLNSSGRIPHAVNAAAYRSPTPDSAANRVGAKAVSTPANVPAWEAMSRRFGTLPWRSLFQPAIRLATGGFALTAFDAALIARAYPDFAPNARRIYGRQDSPLIAGQLLVQRDLGRSLRLIADSGAGVVARGSIAMAIDAAMRSAGGFLALDDLRTAEAEWYRPIHITYRGAEVYTAAPPANAFDALARLGMMERLDARRFGQNSVEYLHRFAEVTKLGFWMRLRFAGDPEVGGGAPVARLLSGAYLDSLVARIDTAHAWTFAAPGTSTSATPDAHTTHFVVADRWGNVVSATQTLGNEFGSRIMPEGTGIWLNNSLAYSTFQPKGNPMDAFPGRHKLSGDVPTIVMRGDRPWIAIGTPGGHTIGQTLPQMVMNIIDFGMDVQAAISAPRVAFVEPDELVIEPGIPTAVSEGLAARGHRLFVLKKPGLGNAHGLTIEYGPSGPVRFVGGTDPRGQGLARGLP